MKKNDNQLIESAISGDKSALIDIIKKYQNSIYSTIYYLKRNDDEISDIMQNVLIKLTNKIHQLRNPVYFKAWLNQIIIHSYYDYLRKNKKLSQISLVENSNKFDIEDHKANPQNNVLYTELDMVIKKTIENLPMYYKIPITLREVQGLSYSDISNITKTSVGTVKSRIARARTIIQDKIKKYTKE